jgi:uncharacterized protein with HEPN domain
MRQDKLYLNDIVEAADAISGFVAGIDREAFVASDLIRSAVIAKLTIIGEAVSRLPQELKLRYPDIEWRKIAAFRNLIVHAYFVIDWEIVWVAVALEVPALRTSFAQILDREFGSPEAPEHS